MHKMWPNQARQRYHVTYQDTTGAKSIEVTDNLILVRNPKELGHRIECRNDKREAKTG